MFSHFIQRILIALITLIGTSLVIFMILAIAPGDPLGELASNPTITVAVRENIRRSLGLDQPIPVRYFKWLISLLKGDLGYSFTSRSSVLALILQRLPTTLWVVGSAYVLSVFIAFPLGIISAIKRYSWVDQLLTTISLMGFSLPTFLTGLISIIIFSVQLKWVPFIYNSTLQVNNINDFGNQIQQSILPIFVLALYQCAVLMRFVRSAVLEQLSQDYIRTAYAKGLSHFAVLKNHLLRNAMIPVVTLIALDIPTIFTGALVTEQVFRVPGIGALMIESIYRKDTPVVMAVTFIYAVLIIIFNTLVDLTYRFLDPRVKYN